MRFCQRRTSHWIRMYGVLMHLRIMLYISMVILLIITIVWIRMFGRELFSIFAVALADLENLELLYHRFTLSPQIRRTKALILLYV